MIAAFRNGQRHPFYKALTALLVMQLVFPVALIQPVMAELITDPRADVQFRPVINNSQGVPVVNIVRPGNNGVSHNKYQDFDVDANGLVFNNSLVNGHSFLAGQLLANPALGGRSASVILNEVTGASDSDLNGLMEVFGDKANIIIANPNGITCDGCGFINTDRASMITGRSFYSDDQLNFDIRDGSVRIEGEGLSYRYKPKALDLLGRYIGIHGEVDVPDSLNIIAGTYDLNYDALISDDNSATAVTVKSPGGTPDRALAIDASVFGAMQAGKINIMGTEKGLGVKADGYLFSHADDLFISSAGGLTVSDADAFKKLTLVAEDELNITDDLIANLSVSVSGNVVSTGDTTSIITQDLTINADSEIDLNGETKSLNLLLSSNNLRSSANLLVLNEADIQTVDNALFQDGDIRINTASLVGGKFGFLDSVLSINILNANAHQWGINNSRFEVSDLTLATDESYIDNAFILVNQLDVNAGSMVVTDSRMSGLDMRFQGSSLGLTDSSWLFNNIDAKTEALNLKQALLMSYRTDLNTAVLISENSSYYSEVLQFRAGADFTSQGDTFQILSFGGEIGESDAGTLDINAGNADFSDTNIRTERFNLTGNNLTLSAGEMLASDLFVTSSSFVAKESARIVATNELAVVSDTIVANAQMYGGNLSVEAADAALSGRYEAADNMSITSGQLATKNSVISARSLAVSGQDLALDATQINAQDVVLSADDDASFSGSVSAEDLKISAQNIDITGQMQLENSAQLTATNALSANSILITADDFAATASQLSINQADIQTGAIQLHANKDAKLSGSIVANELTLTADNAEVSGDYALSDTMVVTAGNRLKSDRIVAQAIDLMLTGNNLEINNNQLTASHISLEAQQDIELSGSVKGKVLLVNGRNADISGHYNLADNLSVTAENQLTINDSDITAKNFSLSGNDLKASEVTVFAENAKLEAMNDASLSASVTGNSLSINAQNVNLSGQYQLAGNVQISAENRLTTDDAEINTADLALSATDLTFSQTDIRAVNSQLTAKKDLTFSGSVVGTSLSVQASNNASLTGNYALSDVLSVAAGNELKVNGIVAEAVNLMLAGDRVSADSAVLESDQTVLTATNDLILSGSIVGNDLIINAANADISGQYGLSNSLSVATTNQLMADNMIAVTDQLKLDGQILVLTNADITADSLYLTSRQDTQLSGAVKGNNLIIRAANADLSGQYQLSDQLSVIASDKLTGQDVSASAKNISLGSQNIILTSADLAADNIHLVADEDIKISGSASGNNLTIAAQNTDLSGQYQFSDNITARAEDQMSTNNADITTASLILTAADLVLTETNIVADSTELVADRDLSLSGTMKGNSLTARSGSDAQLSGEYVLSDTLSVTTGRDLIIDGVVAQAVNLTLNGDNLQAHNVMLGADQAKLMANQNLTISGSLTGNSLDLTASNVNVAGDYKLADNLNIVVADKLTATDADFTTSDLNLAGNNISAVNIDINAETTSLIAKQNLNLSGSVSGNDLIVQAGSAEINGSYSLADQLSVIAQSDITSTTVSINANNLNLKADNITLDNLEVSAGSSYLNADKNISLTGTGSAPVISGDHLSVNAGTDITLTGSYLLADDMSVTAGHDLDVDNIVASSVNILLQGNSISAHGVTLEVNEAQLNSNNELSLDGDISGNNLTVTADQAEISGSFDLSSTLSVITDNELFIDDAHLSASALALKADDLVMNNVSLTTDTASLVADNDIELKTITANTTTASLDDDYQWSDQFSVSAGNNLVINNMVSAAINQMLNAGNNAQLHSVELLADTATIITAQQLDLKGRVDATSLNLTAADASVSGTYKLADSLAITTSNDLGLNNTDINSDKLSVAGNNVNVSASRVNADEIQLTAAQQLNLVAAIAGESLTVTADTASLQGQFDLSDTLSLTTDTHAVLNNSDVAAKNLEFKVGDGEALLKNSSIITTSTDLIADDVNVKNSILNGASVEISSNNLILDADSELGADNVDINVAGRVENSGNILAADELSVIGSNISNNGSVASFANAVIKAANVFENNGVLTADSLVLSGSDVINNNQLGAEYLDLTYQNLANNSGADLVSGNTVYTAKSDTALFNNHGTQTITGTVSWQSEGGSAGTYINAGTLQGSHDVNFSGLANVSNTGDMAVKGTLGIGGEKFVQQGKITAGTLRIDRNNKESFSNQGNISVASLNARSDADFINDGIIEADNSEISFVADAAFINNAAKTFSSENLTIINGAINNQGNIETNNAAFTGNGSQVFSNSGSLIQSAGSGTHHGVTVTGFGTLNNTGKIEADDLVELRMIQTVNNASSGQGIVASGLLADQIGTFNNHSTISVNALNTSVTNMLNTGIIGADEAKITVDGTLNNQGYLYQTGGSTSPSLTNIIGSTAGQFDIQSFGLKNGSADGKGSIEIRNGHLLLSNGNLINTGLIQAQDSGSGNDTLLISGMKNLTNSGDIDLDTELVVTGGSIVNQEGGYLHAVSLAGTDLISFTNAGTTLLDSNATINADTVLNSGLFHADKQINLFSGNITNTENAEISTAGIMRLSGRTDSSLNTLNNAGLIKASGLVLQADQFLNAEQGELSAGEADIKVATLVNQGEIKQSTDQLSSTQRAELGLTDGTAIMLTAVSVINQGNDALINIDNGAIHTSKLKNSGSIQQSAGAVPGDTLFITGVGNLINNGQILLNTNLAFTDGANINNAEGTIKANGISANNISSFNNQGGTLQAQNNLALSSAGDLVNDGNLVGNNVAILVDGVLTNQGLIQGQNAVSLNVDVLNNNNNGVIATVNNHADMIITADSVLSNAGSINSANDLTINTRILSNGNTISGNALTSLNIDELDNRGLIYGGNLNVGSNGQYVVESAAAGVRNFSSGVKQGLVAANELNYYSSGSLNNIYQAKVLNLDVASGHGLAVSGDMLASQQVNIHADSAAFNNTAQIFIGESTQVSRWDIAGELTNNGSIKSASELQIAANNVTNNGGVLADGLRFDLATLANSAGASIQSSGYLSVSGADRALVDDNAVSVVNSGTLASSGYFQLASATLSNNKDAELISAADMTLTAPALLNNGSIHVTGDMTLTTSNLTNQADGLIVTAQGDMNIRGGSGFATNAGQILSAGDLSLAAYSLTNSGNVEAAGDANFNVARFDNQASGFVNVDGVLTFEGTVCLYWCYGVGFSNSGEIYGGTVNARQYSSFTNDGVVVAAGSANEGLGQLIISADSIKNKNFLFANDVFSMNGRLNNGGELSSFSKVNTNSIVGDIHNGFDGLKGIIKTNSGLTVVGDVFNTGYKDAGAAKKNYETIVSYNYKSWDRKEGNKLNRKTRYYFRHDVGYVNISLDASNERSLISVGGDLNIADGDLINHMSDVSVVGLIDIDGGLSNTSEEIKDVLVKNLRWQRKTNNSKPQTNIYGEGWLLAGFNSSDPEKHNEIVDHLVGQISASGSTYYWDGPWARDETGLVQATEILPDSTFDVINPETIGLVYAGGKIKYDGGKYFRNTGNLIAGGIEEHTADPLSNIYDADDIEQSNGVDTVDHTTTTNKFSSNAAAVNATNAVGKDTTKKGSFINGADSVVIDIASGEPSSSVSLLSFILPGLDYSALNAASVAGDKTAEELAAQAALQQQLSGISAGGSGWKLSGNYWQDKGQYTPEVEKHTRVGNNPPRLNNWQGADVSIEGLQYQSLTPVLGDGTPQWQNKTTSLAEIQNVTTGSVNLPDTTDWINSINAPDLSATRAELNQARSSLNKGQDRSMNNGRASLFDLDPDILSRIIADTEYELQPDYIFKRLTDTQLPDTEPVFLLDPYQEAQAITQAALAQTGTAYFSPDWSSSAEQRQALYDNTVSYLEQHQSNGNLQVGQALTRDQIAQLEAPMIWYVSMNIGGTQQLVPTVYLPEATLEQITTPAAGSIVADSIDISVGDFTNTGNINVKNSANIYAESFKNQRNVMRFGDGTNYNTIAGNGGNISAGSLSVVASNDINNNGGSLTTSGDMNLQAGGDINFNALQLDRRSQSGKNIDEHTEFLTSQIRSGGNASFHAGGDFNSEAAKFDIGGNALVDAENINLQGVTERDYQQRYSEKKGTFSSSKTTTQQETLTFQGTELGAGGNLLLNARNDMTLVGADVSAGGNATLNAENNILITAGINQDSYSKEKSGSGVATTSAQQKGHVKQEAVGSTINSGGNLQINSNGGDVAILASQISADNNITLGDTNLLRDENGAPVLDDNGQFISADGSSIGNLTVGTVELKDEEWNVKQSGLKGPLKNLASAAMFVAGSMGVTSQLEALGVDTTLTVGHSEEQRVETTHNATSSVDAGGNLIVRVDDHLQVDGSQINAAGNGYIETGSTTVTAVMDSTTTTESSSEQTVASTKPAVGKQEVTVAGVTATDHTETTTTTQETAVTAGLNVGGNLIMNSEGDINLLGSDLSAGGDASLTAQNINVEGVTENSSTTHTEKTEVSTTSLGVKNAYVDAVYAADAVAQAGADVEAAKNALADAERRIKDGSLAASALDDYKANLAAATTQLAQATLNFAAAGGTAAASTGTGGFYASASAQTTTTEKESTSTSQTYVGSNINVGGNASFNATDALNIIGSSVNVQDQLALNGNSVTITAGTEESTSSSSEQTYSAGMSFSNSGGNDSFSANASANSSESDSYSKTHVNSSINAGSLTSASDQLTIAGANIEIQNDIDITTGQLTIASLQDESRSSSHSEGYNVSGSVGGSLPIDPSNIGGNQNDSSSDSKWVNNQTTLIGGASGNGKVTINADKTEITGATVASATRNEDGTLTDNGNLTLITDELTVTNLYDHNTSESSGVNISAGVSSSGTTTVGLTNNGHNTEQTSYATLGGGTVQKKDGTAHDIADVNNDLSNTQEITLDQQTGGLDATVTVDHRLTSEQGRAQIQEDVTKSGMIVDTVALIATTDRVGITDFFKETGKSHTTYEAIKSEIANNPELAAQLTRDDLAPAEKEAMLNELTHSVMVELGYSTGDYQNVLVANEQDHVVKDGATYERHGFYSEETQNAYINDAFISDTQGLVSTAGHELSHAMDDRTEAKHSEQDNEIYATQYGNNFGDYTHVAMAVTGNGSMAGNNQHVGNNSEKVRGQTESYNQLDKSKGDDFLQFIPPLIAAGAMIASDIPSANGPSPDDNLDEIPQSRSLLPIDVLGEGAKELTDHQYDTAIDFGMMVGNPSKLIKDGADILGSVAGKAGKTDGSDVQEVTQAFGEKLDSGSLPSGYTRNADGTVTGPRDGVATPTGQYDIETKNEIMRRESGGYYTTAENGTQQTVNSPYPNGGSSDAQVVQNRIDGSRREAEVEAELKEANPNASVQSEQFLRDKNGHIVVDRITGERRRVDHVVIEDGRVTDAVETTSLTAKKDAQKAKEDRIIEQGGNFVKDRDTECIIPIDCEIRLERRE